MIFQGTFFLHSAMELYYAPGILDQKYFLPEQESFHCIKVLRHREGDIIHIIDGSGGLYQCEITSAHKEHCGFKIINAQNEFGKRTFHLHIAIAPTKNNERFEWFLEKATEIGIDEITPLICEHSERRKIKTERLNQILVSAMKQSQRAYLPVLNELTDFHDFIKKTQSTSGKFICHLDEKNKIHFKSAYKPGTDSVVLIGPEGDFSQQEISLATQNDFRQVILGTSRLRTETAGLVAVHTVNMVNE